MNIHLKQLVNLSKIDKEIDAFEPEIQAINEKVTDITNKREKIETITLNLKNDIKESELKKHKNELHLTQLSEKLVQNGKRSADIKNEREMKSLQLEKEIAKEQIIFANEEIERLDKLIENRQAEIDADAKTLSELIQLEKKMKDKILDEVSRIEKKRRAIFPKKEKLIVSMNQKSLAFYEKIRRWAKNTTVVEVKKQACYGCYIKISDKVYADVIMGEEIITCPHCGRLLYIEQNKSETSVA